MSLAKFLRRNFWSRIQVEYVERFEKTHRLHVLIIESPNLIIKFLFVDPESRPGAALKSQWTHHLLHVVSPAFIGLSKSICRIKVKMLLRAHSHLLTIYPLDSVSVRSGWPQWLNPARLRLAHLNHCTCLVLRRWLSHRHSDDAVRSIAFGVTDV